MASPVIESDFDTTHYNQHPTVRPVINPSSHMRSENKRTLPDLSVVTNTCIGVIVEHCLAKWTNRLQYQILRAV